MATKTTNSSNNRQSVQAPPQSQPTTLQWIAGIVLLFSGVFLFLSIFSSFFNWSGDQSIVNCADPQLLANDVKIGNMCGEFGVKFAQWIVGGCFGLFSLLLPVIMMMLGVRIIYGRKLLLSHLSLSLMMIMILGSLTLGAIFGDKWIVVSRSGLGGEIGNSVAAWLYGYTGAGVAIILLVCWILVGVYINRNFIKVVNKAGANLANNGGKVIEKVISKKSKTNSHNQDESVEDEPDAEEQASQIPTPKVKPAQPFVREEPKPITIVEREEEIQPVILRPEPELSNVNESPLELISTEEEIKVIETPNPATKIDPRGRIVMGASGIVEIDMDQDLSDDEEESPEEQLGIQEIELGEEFSDPLVVEPTHDVRRRNDGGELGIEELTIDDQPLPTIDEVQETEGESGLKITVETHEDEMSEIDRIKSKPYDPLMDLPNYTNPPISHLIDYKSSTQVSDEEIFQNKSRIQSTLKDFGIPIQTIHATVGPTVTLYEIVQAQGVKISKIQGLENDIAQSLKALGIRIIAPIPGRGTIGIEVPNRDKQIVSMYSAVLSKKFQESTAELPVVIGRTIQNENYVFDLAKMPHLLVAGATGQGKSVGLNAIITSLLYKKKPSQLKFVMIDPKMVEFSLYSKIEKHFLAKMESEDEAIVTDPKKAVYTLNALCGEMDSRLTLCKEANARNIIEYNKKYNSRVLLPNKGHRYLPYIVVVVDEFADLIMTAREVEAPVMRLAQKARAVGIHLIIATQRPDVKVITGGIKANFPARIAFRVMQMIDSRTIIDQPGANQLIGRGDMLFTKDGELTRIQCALVETNEVENIVEHISKQQCYSSAYNLPDYVPDSAGGDQGGSGDSSAPVKYDSLFCEIARAAVSGGQLSTSSIQRNYEVGFNRAGRIMMQLERAGIVGRQEGARPRDILFHDMPSLEAKLQDLGLF